MSASFEIPEWLTSPDLPQAPPDTSEVDPHRHLDDASDGINRHATRNRTS